MNNQGYTYCELSFSSFVSLCFEQQYLAASYRSAP